MELELQGKDGEETVTVDNLGKVLDIDNSKTVDPVAGNDVYLTIDSDWQKSIYQILEQRVAGIVLSKLTPNKSFDYEAEKDASKITIPIYDVDTLDKERLIHAAVSGMDQIMGYLAETKYGDGALALAESASAFERWCDNQIMETIRPQLYNSFSLGPLVAYVLARENEIKTVRIILTGKRSGLPEEFIRERAREMYV